MKNAMDRLMQKIMASTHKSNNFDVSRLRPQPEPIDVECVKLLVLER